jgi:hypothetical protein
MPAAPIKAPASHRTIPVERFDLFASYWLMSSGRIRRRFGATSRDSAGRAISDLAMEATHYASGKWAEALSGDPVARWRLCSAIKSLVAEGEALEARLMAALVLARGEPRLGGPNLEGIVGIVVDLIPVPALAECRLHVNSAGLLVSWKLRFDGGFGRGQLLTMSAASTADGELMAQTLARYDGAAEAFLREAPARFAAAYAAEG